MGSTNPVVVLGGGFAGLACATVLAEAGIAVIVLEKKPHLGGRAYSFRDPKTGETVDNGQHLFMGCYRQTREFLRRIGSESLLHFPSTPRVHYVDRQGQRDLLSCPSVLPAPLHLAWGVFRLSGLALRDKAQLFRFDRYMRRLGSYGNGLMEQLDRVTVRDWLTSLGQTYRTQERLFDPIAIGALNERPETASAAGFVQVLREIFYRDAESSRFGLSSVGLSELYTEQSRKFIESRGGRVLCNQKISAIVESGGLACEVRTDRGERFEAGAVVSTLPPWSLDSVERPKALSTGLGLSKWKTTPIIGINLWLDVPIFEEPLFGMLGTDVHWAFNRSAIWRRDSSSVNSPRRKGQYLSLVISGAHEHVAKSPPDLYALACRDLGACFPEFKKAKIETWSVVKEPHATPMPVCGLESLRPGHQTLVPNFFLAGDWTRTGLPATIESAVASGHACAKLILEHQEGLRDQIR